MNKCPSCARMFASHQGQWLPWHDAHEVIILCADCFWGWLQDENDEYLGGFEYTYYGYGLDPEQITY